LDSIHEQVFWEVVLLLSFVESLHNWMLLGWMILSKSRDR
jgi:hypothetical protein